MQSGLGLIPPHKPNVIRKPDDVRLPEDHELFNKSSYAGCIRYRHRSNPLIMRQRSDINWTYVETGDLST